VKDEMIRLDVSRILGGSRLILIGGTGFLGKLFCSMILDRYPEVGRLFVVVRPKGEGAPARFASEVMTSEVFEPLRRKHAARFAEFAAEKIETIPGDMGQPLCGIDEARVGALRGTIDAVINIAGVVDFNPPLDEALDANAFGTKNLVALARALGDVPVLHTSTCYVAGRRKGPIREEDPRVHPFPRADELGVKLWDPECEIAECLNLVVQAERRSEDAFRQSEFAERARDELALRGEPAHGDAYERRLASVKRKFVVDQVVQAGLDRATHWGWPNIYTYSKAIGEQVVAASGLPFAIARPSGCESTVAFPAPAYNEGINTSAPLIYLMMKGQQQILAQHVPLDLIPSDFVVAGMILVLAELLEGTAKPVYQLAASDVNPCSSQRFGELVGLYKRKHYQQRGTGNPFFNALQARFEPTFVDRATFDRTGPPAIASISRELAALLRKSAPVLAPAARTLEGIAKRERKIAEIQHLFEPFSSKANGPFDCSNIRAAYARLSESDKTKLPWAPESIDWADWMMNVHMPAIEKRIVPAMDQRLNKPIARPAPHATLVTLLEEMAERHDLALFLQHSTADGLTRTTFRDTNRRASSTAARLAAVGVKKGDRVVLSASNHPDWAIAYFGIVRAGATAVPLDPALSWASWEAVLAESGARVVVFDDTVQAKDAAAAALPQVTWLDLHEATEEDGLLGPNDMPDVRVEPDDVASIVYTNAAAGRSHGVMFTHASFTSLVASLAPLFPLSQGDCVLSVLPLHQPFEFTCGLLLPLTRGARVVYLSELTGDTLVDGLRMARPAAITAAPAVWQLLEHRILQGVDTRGPLARAAFDAAAEVSRWLASHVGVEVGRVLFGPVHATMGGRVKWLVSGGAALPRETQERFVRMGLKWTEGSALARSAQQLLPASGRGLFVEPAPAVPPGGAHVRLVDSEDRTRGDGSVRTSAANGGVDAQDPLVLPEPVRQLGKAFVGKLQDLFYGDVMRPRVYGRAYIPHNRNVMVVANHTSHLDMGFVRYALGRYGQDIVSLAAQDYFFESGYKRAFFENLTNLRPVDRKASLRQAIRQASEVIERGKIVLVFPEGTRSPTGEVQEFKPLVGHLALVHAIDILPVFLGGTHASLPKGATVPRKRDIVARIGPPLLAADVRRLTEGLSMADAAREVARIAREAVIALRDGKVIDLANAKERGELAPAREHPLVKLFGELESKFRAGELQTPVSYYVSLGNDQLAKWTVRVDANGCEVRPGKPEGGQADCVLKTSPEFFAKIVRECYVPSAADFMSGAIKSNDVGLLVTFQKVFQLDQAS
jgi:1-acyl-sn-glycerol-3-phosphate acyltransferase